MKSAGLPAELLDGRPGLRHEDCSFYHDREPEGQRLSLRRAL